MTTSNQPNTTHKHSRSNKDSRPNTIHSKSHSNTHDQFDADSDEDDFDLFKSDPRFQATDNQINESSWEEQMEIQMNLM